MKHLPRIYAEQAALSASNAGSPYGTVAQEGFVDAVKDFFTFKASPSNASVVNKAAEEADSSSRIQEIRSFTGKTEVDIVRFVFKRDKPVSNLANEINVDARNNVNDVLKNIVRLLKGAEADTTGDQIEKDLNSVITAARTRLDSVAFLNNFYVDFKERKTSEGVGYHVDEDIDPSMRRSENLIDLAINVVVYAVNSHAASKLLESINKNTMSVDVGAYSSATKGLSKSLKESVNLIEQFVGEYTRHKKHDNKHVRHVLRYGHNVVGVLTYIAAGYRPFFQFEQ